MQVLKEEVRQRILAAAEDLFYQHDYRSTKLTDIAARANVPVALIYSYFRNKAALFDAVVQSVYDNFYTALEEEEAMGLEEPAEAIAEIGLTYIFDLFKDHRRFVILVDKSAGTRHEHAKDQLVDRLQKHIVLGLPRYTDKTYDPIFLHILANNFTEGMCEIARHYKGQQWATDMFNLLLFSYMKGIEAL